jgi:hypothetical protein
MIQKGMIVKFKKEYISPCEQALTFIALTDEEKGRLEVGTLESANWTYPPVETVHVEQIESAEFPN